MYYIWKPYKKKKSSNKSIKIETEKVPETKFHCGLKTKLEKSHKLC